jgi:hypothetical protein
MNAALLLQKQLIILQHRVILYLIITERLTGTSDIFNLIAVKSYLKTNDIIPLSLWDP